MTRDENALTVWTPVDVIAIPSSADTPDEIVTYGNATLSKRDMNAIVAGFQAQGYEMVSTFIWTKASATLKKQVASLGMEFVGEMLGRPDLTDDADPTSAIGDHEAISLAEDLGMITSTQALRLKQSMQLVNHFASLEEEDEDDQMHKSEAVTLLRTCITSVLGKPRFDTAIQFADFRRRLGARTFKQDDGDIALIKSSPYFFVRTTLSVLMSLVKTANGATLEHAVNNTTTLVPELWERLRESEKWQVGQSYAETNSAGNRIAALGLKRALLKVHGFDFVPESLRSQTFTEAAAKVLSAHFAMNNFYNEREPMESLADLGTSVPMPAFAKCMEATLAVRLGNAYGVCWNAQDAANRVLNSLSTTRWEYYFNHALPRDKTVLDKIASDSKPVSRWIELVNEFMPEDFEPKDQHVKRLLEATTADKPDTERIKKRAGIVRQSHSE